MLSLDPACLDQGAFAQQASYCVATTAIGSVLLVGLIIMLWCWRGCFVELDHFVRKHQYALRECSNVNHQGTGRAGRGHKRHHIIIMDECGGDVVPPPPRWRRGAIRCLPASSDPEADDVDDADGRKKNPPSFPCRHLRGAAPPAHRRSIIGRADGGDDDDGDWSSVAIRPGPHGLHAYASRDLKAGSVIVRCLPLAHSILVPPGTTTTTTREEDEDEDDEYDDGGGGGGGGRGRRRRCARCFFGEGESDHSDGRREARFGRCSRCRAVHYCSRSCQVRCGASMMLMQHPPRR